VQQRSLPSSTEERMIRRARVSLVAALPVVAAYLLSTGCSAGVAANRRSPGVTENGAFRPTRPAAANYGPDPSLTCPERGINGLVNEQVGGAAKPEGRLCAVADTLLGWEGGGNDMPPESVLAVISYDFGLPQIVRNLVITDVATAEQSIKGQVEGASERDVAAMVVEPIKTFAATAQAPRYGLIVQRIKKGTSRIVLVMQDQTIELQPVPRKLNPGQNATLSGKLAGSLVNPKVEYTDAVGKLERAQSQSGKAFTAELKCGDRPGRIIVQVVGEKEGADVPLASFPIGCGTELPVSAAVSPGAGKAAVITDPATGEKQLATMINQDRTAAGLKALEVDEDLSKVARSLSDDRAKGKGTTSEEVQRRLRELDISAPTILVSEAMALSAEDAYGRFSNSPQDRANAMSPDVNQVGVGITPGPPVNNRATVIVTELFLKQLPPPNPEEIKANLYKEISRRRADARAGAVAADPQLEQIAQAYASEMAKQKGKVPREKVAEIEAPLYRSFATVNELGGLKADPLEFAEEPGIVGDAKLVGVGVGVGSSPQFGKNSTYVVILMGKKPSAKAPGAARQPVKKRK
jgi:uncharacterized protein YkwD